MGFIGSLHSRLTQCFGDGKRPGTRRYERPRNVRKPMFRVPPKGQSAFAAMMIDEKVITRVHLGGGEEPCQGGHQVALNGPLQVPSSVILVRSLLEQEPAALARMSTMKSHGHGCLEALRYLQKLLLEPLR